MTYKSILKSRGCWILDRTALEKLGREGIQRAYTGPGIICSILFASHCYRNLSVKLGGWSKIFLKISLLMYFLIHSLMYILMIFSLWCISQLKRLNNVKLTHSSGNAGIPFNHSLQPFFLPRGKSYYQCGLNYSSLFF